MSTDIQLSVEFGVSILQKIVNTGNDSPPFRGVVTRHFRRDWLESLIVEDRSRPVCQVTTPQNSKNTKQGKI